MKRALYISLIYLCAVACQDSINEPAEINSTCNHITVELEDFCSTRTTLDENNNIIWNNDDQLVGFMQTTLPSRYMIDSESVGTQSGNFTLIENHGSTDHIVTGTELAHNVILYPYSESSVCYKADNSLPESSYRLRISIPEVQVYQKASFAANSFPMVAVSSDNRFCFKNICGAIILPLKGDTAVKSVTLSGCNDEILSGLADIQAYLGTTAPSVSMTGSDGHEVVLSCPDPVQLNSSEATPFIISVVPTEFQKGMTVKILDSEDKSYVFTNSSMNVVKRSGLLRMPEIELGYISMKGVQLDYSNISIVIGSKFVLKPVFTPLHPSNTIVSWQSSNPSVAAVDSGEVIALSAGTAIITVTTDDGGFSALCEVTVADSVSKPDQGGLEGTEDEDLNI